MNKVLTYKEIIGRLFSDEAGALIPDGVMHSLPVLSHAEDGTTVDCFFLYGILLKERKYFAPYARVGLNAGTGALAFYHLATEKPFSALGKDLMPECDAETNARQLILHEQQENLYPQIREFAFCTAEKMTDKQYSLLSAYSSVFSEIVDSALLVFYNDLAPEYFAWISDILGH